MLCTPAPCPARPETASRRPGIFSQALSSGVAVYLPIVMHDKHIWQLPLATLTGVFLLSVLWEFLIEPVIAPLLPGDYRDESARERWEYVVTNLVFAGREVPQVTLLLGRGAACYRVAVLRACLDAAEMGA